MVEIAERYKLTGLHAAWNYEPLLTRWHLNGRLSDQISIPNLLHRSLAQGSVVLNCYIAGSAHGWYQANPVF